jgi:hypothetical protein
MMDGPWTPALHTVAATHIELAQHVSAFVRLSIVQGVQIYLKLILNKKANDYGVTFNERTKVFAS